MDVMTSVMEQGRLVGTNSSRNHKVQAYQKMFCCVTAFLVILLLPYIHIGVIHLKFWVPNKAQVDREHCTCGCFDTVYKGSYEKPGNVRYKHIYFNATHQTFKIWLLTLAFVLVFSECLKHLLSLWLLSRLRWTMLIVFISDIFPHYYSWWSAFNYYNDDFYEQFYHQLFFSTTELLATVVVVYLCDSQVEITASKVLVVVSISCVHLIVGGLDQFVSQVFLDQGKLFQRVRNIGFLIPDFIHIFIPLCNFYRKKDGKECTRFQCFCFVLSIFAGVCIGRFLLT
ncbi:hypothetical protein CHS0354_003227 [Potamilus streckersoni]|uniref:Uncharacterized protein n=1 Tax=Potamilus streckersoni TaxID=2493646 RepID=A0AAE0VWQ9_9BIVA|nr:hypothetical protein CHS0354_003227 [Potamilus streckersoni]